MVLNFEIAGGNGSRGMEDEDIFVNARPVVLLCSRSYLLHLFSRMLFEKIHLCASRRG